MLRKNDEACLSSISRSMEGRCRVHRRPMMRPEGIIPSGPTYIPTTPCLSTTHRREKICELRTKSCNTRAALFSANRIARVFTYELVRLRGNISYHIMYRKYPRGGDVYSLRQSKDTKVCLLVDRNAALMLGWNRNFSRMSSP